MIEAAVEAGYEPNDDFNDGQQAGFGFYQVTQKNGMRHSTAAAFLKPIRQRSNLTIETGAQVTKLCIEERRCTGVEYLQAGRIHAVLAETEVILCGGAINSPQLLLLSGIGPADHLQEMGIEVVFDLPGVGQNLHDHLATMVCWHAKQKNTLANAESLGQLVKLLLFKRGKLTSNVGEAGGFVQLYPESEAPELQFHFAPAFFIRHGYDAPVDGRGRPAHGITIGPTLVKVESRGTLRLQSPDPLAHPLIDPNVLSHPRDLEILVKGVRIAQEIGHQPALAPFIDKPYLPTAGEKSDEEIVEHIRQNTQSLYHPVGTCKMGVDQLAVVSPELKVHGISRLRVADASIMPTVVNANTNAPAIMIGEKCADMILNGN